MTPGSLLVDPFSPGPGKSLLRSLLGFTGSYAETLREHLHETAWCVDFVDVGDDAIDIGGWAIAPDNDHSRLSFTVNDVAFQHVTYPLPRPDIERLYWYVPNAGLSGFRCTARVAPYDRFAHGHAVLRCVDQAAPPAGGGWQDVYYPDPETACLNLPDPVRMAKVHGSAVASSFVLEGYSAYVKLELTLQRLFGRGFEEFAHILDWGCGCGRLARYFEGRRVSLTGIDIDGDNLRWCRVHLPFGEFLATPLQPPTKLAAGSFDLIIGVSVFTHLSEQDQYAWLEELRRTAAPGAVVLMTTHGDAAAGRALLSPRQYRRWQRRGYLDAGRNRDLRGAIPSADYYRNAFHTADYVRTRWSRYFEVVDLVPGYIGNLQDLVVMRRV